MTECRKSFKHQKISKNRPRAGIFGTYVLSDIFKTKKFFKVQPLLLQSVFNLAILHA